MKFLRYILVPFVPIYWIITWVRNLFYDYGIFYAEEYSVPVICVGNLSTGGTGKTPMIEYLVEILSPKYTLAILSRGYKRSTEGFVLAIKGSRGEDLGDEPYQMYRKFDNVIVAVDSNRRNGIKELLNLEIPPEVILLDDAFQHRQVKAGLNILLTTYQNPYYSDIVLPTGNLREPRTGAKRANLVVVTKCPDKLPCNQKECFRAKLSLEKDQELHFASIEYLDTIYGSGTKMSVEDLRTERFTLVTGIANPKPLVKYLKSKNLEFDHFNFPDHHNFSKSELISLREKKLVLTTEKDFVRMENIQDEEKLFYLPIKTRLHDNSRFEKRIIDFCEGYSMGAAVF